MKKLYARVIGGILLGLGIVMLMVSILLFVNPQSESAWSGLLLIVSIIANVTGIMFLSYTPSKKKK